MKQLFNSWNLGVKQLGRDWRSGELRLLALSLVIAVAAMTSVGFFVDRLRSGLERDAAQLLGADLVLTADQPIDDSLRNEARTRGLSVADTVVFPSMAVAGEQARLTSVKAASPGYPLRGQLRVASKPGGEDVAATDLPAPDSVWVDSALLAQLQIQMGDSIQLGDRKFRIDRVVTIEPDRGISFVSIAPRVLMRLDDLASTNLIQPGSRETRSLLVAGSAPAIQGYRDWLTPRLARGQRLASLDNGRPELRSTLDRAEQFLSLVALLTAMLSAVAVALAARRFTQRHLDSCAVLRCLGLSQGELLQMHLAEFVLIGIIGAGLGVIFGFAAHFVFIELLGALVQSGLPPPSVLPALQGFLVGFVLLIGFAMPPVMRLRHVPPIRVLRRDVGPPNASASLGYGLGIALFAGLLLWTARDLKIGLYTAGGFAAAFAIFALVAWGALKAVGRLRHTRGLSASVRFALASMERRPAATVVQTVALAVGLMALLLLSVTRNDLISAWRQSAPPNAPNRFVINIQPDQRAGFLQEMKAGGLANFDFAPMIRGRMIAHNGQTIGPANYPDDRAQRLVEREFNLSYLADLPAHNRIVAGKWFGPEGGELSIEEGIAKTLKINLGDSVTFDIGGQQVEARVTSFRKLDWDSMHVNFFVIFPPAALATMPQTSIAAFHLDPAQADLTNQLVRDFPNITVIDTGAILRQIQGILDQVVRAVEFLFVFTLGAGLMVLYAALLSSRDERTRESALLRALGASRSQLSRAQVTEFAGVGILAGTLAATGAVAVGWVLATQAFNFPYRFSLAPWLIGIVGGSIIALLGGWLGLRSVLNQPPLVTLRDV